MLEVSRNQDYQITAEPEVLHVLVLRRIGVELQVGHCSAPFSVLHIAHGSKRSTFQCV